MKIENIEIASEAIELCREIIKKHGLHHLAGVNIPVYFALKPRYSKGELVRADSRLCSEVEQMLHDSNVQGWILVDQGYWLDYPDRREPLLYHELLKFWYDEEKGAFSLRKPHIAEFPEVVQQYGDWTGDFRPVRDHLSSGNTDNEVHPRTV